MTDAHKSQAEWIRRVLDEYEAPLLRYARRLIGDDELARDVVQETFLRLCREQSAELDGRVAPWLFRVCRQRAIDTHRKEQQMKTAAPATIDAQASTMDGPTQRLEQRDDQDALLRLLQSLPENQQEVLRLKFQADLSYREISEVTNQSISNVGFLIHTALKRMREEIRRAEERSAISS